MIEVQIKDKELYNNLKSYSNYNSDITQVCSFRDEMAELLELNNISFSKDSILKEKVKPTLTIQGRNIMKLENANAEMLHFVGVRSELDPTIPISSMDRVNILIENDLVILGDKFKKLYSKLSYRSKIQDLISANVRFYGKGKLVDFIDGGLTIQSMNLLEIKETKINYKQMQLKVIEPLLEKDKYHEIKCELVSEKTQRKVILKFYQRPAILKSIAFLGNKIEVSASKITEDNNYDYLMTDPIILPKKLNFNEYIAISPIKRLIPADLFRNAYYEFQCRYNMK